MEGTFPIDWPRVPGHEAVGRIDALGAHVLGWVVRQRVGVGFLGGSCGHCRRCRGGDLVHCENQEFTSVSAKTSVRDCTWVPDFEADDLCCWTARKLDKRGANVAIERI